MGPVLYSAIHKRPIPPTTTTEHPVVYSGLYWSLRWTVLESAVHSCLYWSLPCAILESAGGSIL
eukprot:9450489-Lingulodinium_polyedra.AAC.1